MAAAKQNEGLFLS